jgi:hypothetical protein
MILKQEETKEVDFESLSKKINLQITKLINSIEEAHLKAANSTLKFDRGSTL